MFRVAPPGNTTVPHPTPEGTIEDANSCSINEEATYMAPLASRPHPAFSGVVVRPQRSCRGRRGGPRPVTFRLGIQEVESPGDFNG